jgi:hypothetical protein
MAKSKIQLGAFMVKKNNNSMKEGSKAEEKKDKAERIKALKGKKK